MTYFGKRLRNNKEHRMVTKMYDYTDSNIGITNSAYTPSGTWNINEPAIQVTHADGNTSLELKYVSHTTKKVDENINLTTVLLKDPVYDFQVSLNYKVFIQQNVFEQWVEIVHQEPANVILHKYSSANLYLNDGKFYLTTFHNEWAKEMQPSESKLSRGITVIESKLGTRTMLLKNSAFVLSANGEANENFGTVVLGQLAWSGNFKMEYEIDSYDNLRLIAGINPYSSQYTLQPGETFKTPSFIYTISHNGTGQASRNLHDWARNFQVLDGNGDRLTLLNNWEATYFDFNEKKIVELFDDAKALGVDLFLLDDGWFANKYPRNNDRAGLGDWQENVKKLPHGVGYLVKEASKKDIKFGIWIEPEMVNPKSELYENHPDWVIRQPERPEVYFRNQLVLDLSNPEVQDFVFNIVDKLFVENPELAFIKWDCNAVIFNARSDYLGKNKIPQTHLYIEYVKGLYKALERIRAKYPKIPMMLCSGGGGRVDYEMLKYFTEFWPSDNTDPLERIFMQWNYSYFFPSVATDCHVTNWSDESVKYKVDVASMGKLGFDIVAHELDDTEMQFCKQAIQNYDSFKEVVWRGDLYRLVNPFENDMASLMFVTPDKNRAIVFNYVVNTRVKNIATEPITLSGLDEDKQYTVKEINLWPGSISKNNGNQTFSGDLLMNVGINIKLNKNNTSIVLEIKAVE